MSRASRGPRRLASLRNRSVKRPERGRARALSRDPVLGDGSAALRFSTVRPGRTLIPANAVPGRLQAVGTSTRSLPPGFKEEPKEHGVLDSVNRSLHCAGRRNGLG
jgi:hypothetical protein